MNYALLSGPKTSTATPTNIKIRDDLNKRVIETETLPDGSVVWVATDTELDGCIAQAEGFEEVKAALDAAREQYRDALHDTGGAVAARKVAPASTEETNSISPGVVFLGMLTTTRTG